MSSGGDLQWSGQFMGMYVTENQSIAIDLCIVMIVAMGCCIFLWLSDCYRLCPGWTKIRKFDGDAREVRARAQEGDGRKAYGACGGTPSWGVLEAPSRSVPVEYPGMSGATVREGFQDTQRLREESSWWARDEPHFLAKAGFAAPPLRINEAHVTCPQRMV
eukprot:TRINITY_DN6838_c0_g1_i1.p1 TRINITY_DN6838_c0_g1~~TRINITY_DN6838_c0_g1_i1.p1  ORF type:complete len:161 (-),score=17.19 TRINITY_DN6838_c0_g1_i1:53-535(-)